MVHCAVDIHVNSAQRADDDANDAGNFRASSSLKARLMSHSHNRPAEVTNEAPVHVTARRSRAIITILASISTTPSNTLDRYVQAKAAGLVLNLTRAYIR